MSVSWVNQSKQGSKVMWFSLAQGQAAAWGCRGLAGAGLDLESGSTGVYPETGSAGAILGGTGVDLRAWDHQG